MQYVQSIFERDRQDLICDATTVPKTDAILDNFFHCFLSEEFFFSVLPLGDPLRFIIR